MLDRSLFSLSSGEKQRIAIASVCALDSKTLVLDEPTANLDSEGILQLSALLARLKDSGITIILSEHRLHYVRNSFDRMVVMAEGEISCVYTREQALALPKNKMAEMGLRLFDEPSFQAGKSITQASAPAVAASQLSLTFSGQNVLNDVNIEADKSMITAVTGGNGAGKSSLCRVLAGLYKPQTGLVFLHGELMKRKKRIKNTFFVQQDTDYQLYGATVREEFLIGASHNRLTDKEITEYLRAVGLADIFDRHPLSLSGGQKQRLLLALSLASGRDILILDEPTSGLDGANMRLLAKLFREQAKEGRTFILITHDKEFIHLCADSVLHLDKGKVYYHRRIQRD